MKRTGTPRRLVAAYTMAGLLWSGQGAATVVIVDAQDQLDRSVAGPDLLGGKYEDAFDLSVGDREYFDNNVYRLSDGTAVTAVVGPQASREDHINAPSAGLAGQWSFGRQVVNIALQAQDNRFAQNTDLNNVSSNDKLGWNWGVGSIVSGQVGIEYLRALAGFANVQSYAKNVYDQTSYYTAVRYQVGPRLAIYGGILNSIFGLTDKSTEGNNSGSKSADMGIEVVSDVDNTLGVDYRYTDARYGHSVALDGTTFDADFREDRIRMLLKRALSDKTSIDLSAGYLKREYPSTVINSFSGPIWRASFGWQPTGKTQVLAATWRNLQSYVTDQTNYYRATGVSVTPSWNPTEKLFTSISASRENQTYIGSSSIELNELARRDTVNSAVAKFGYLPTDALSLDISYTREQRDSTEAQRAYTDGIANVHVQWVFR